MIRRAWRFALRVLAIAGKESLHIVRDPRTLYMALGLPVVLLVIFGYGVTFDIDHIPLAVIDLDRTDSSRAVARHFLAAREFTEVEVPTSLAAKGPNAAAEAMLRAGKATAVLMVPQGAGADLLRGRIVTLQMLVDGADGVQANQVLAKADAIARSASAVIAPLPFSGGAPLSARSWVRFNPEGRSQVFLVPGLAAYIVAIASVMLTALAIATEWERGSMEQLFAAPIGRSEIIFGKLLPYLGLGFVQMLLVLAAGVWIFDVPIRGSIVAILAAGLLFLVAMLGQGLVVSIVARSQMVATQAGMISSVLPALLLSGFVFPIENMPRVLQWLSVIVPARYFVHLLRAVMLKGVGAADLWRDYLGMAIFAAVILTIATVKFRRRIA